MSKIFLATSLLLAAISITVTYKGAGDSVDKREVTPFNSHVYQSEFEVPRFQSELDFNTLIDNPEDAIYYAKIAFESRGLGSGLAPDRELRVYFDKEESIWLVKVVLPQPMPGVDLYAFITTQGRVIAIFGM